MTPPTRRVLTLALAGLAARALLAALAPLGVDEAYYVDWARHLQAGYLDHPPAIAWLVAGPLALLGPHPLAVRLLPLLLQVGTTLLAADLARARGGERAGAAAALALQAAPVFSLGAMLATPDAPLAFAWVGTLWALDRATRRDPRWFLAAGGFLGLAALSKLTAGLLGLAALLALLATPRGRRLLASPWPWLGALVALALASPVLSWNAARGWPSLAFQARHGARGRSFSLVRFLASLGAQAAYVSPLLFVLAGRAAVKRPPDDDPARLALSLSGLPVVAFFTLAAAFTPGALPHWPAPGWLSALLLLPAALGTVAGRRAFRIAVGTGFAFSAAAVAALTLPLPFHPSPRDELAGWEEAARAARGVSGGARLAATHWIGLGQLGWYAGAPVAYVGEVPCAASFYEPDPRRSGEPLLVVAADGLGPSREKLEATLGPLEPAGGYEARDGARLLRRFRFYRTRPR
ncbi:MAG TPA: glycosyltransferase family 39 protein [Anaeromyxobacteraceae bacterium]|nr:glycosyltransferase family 39 protein [Anaeromyxobacteraceae bacterium]